MINGNYNMKIAEETDSLNFNTHFTENFKIISDELKNVNDKCAQSKKESSELIDGKIDGLSKYIYEEILSDDLLTDKTITNNFSVNTDEKTNAPFSNEDYSYKDETTQSNGSYISSIVELKNGKYQITSNNKITSTAIYVYNPYNGCYEDIDTWASSAWKQDGDVYTYEFEVNTQYTHNYIRVQSPSNSINTANLKIQENIINEHYVRKEDKVLRTVHNEVSLKYGNLDLHITPREGAPFSEEIYSWYNDADFGEGYSVTGYMELKNGNYRIVSNKESIDFKIGLYNPYKGCYEIINYNLLKKDENQYVYKFDIDTNYTSVYIMLRAQTDKTLKFTIQEIEKNECTYEMLEIKNEALQQQIDTINNELANTITNTTDITELKQAVNILSNIDFANRYYPEEAQANTPFVTENYEYIAPVEASTGIYSEAFLLPNGKYRIVVTSKNSPSNMEIAIYNPIFGCYYYDLDKDVVGFDWIKQDDKYICDFEIKTDYEQNYVMLGDVSKNMDRWNNLNVKLYRYNQSENMVTKAEFNKQSDDIANLTANQLYVSNAGYLYTKNAIVLNGATAIGNKGYYSCQNLLNVTIQESVNSIGSEAFAHSYKLKSVVISNGVTSIGTWAFVNCTGLENLVLPASLTSIGSSPFSGCTALNTVTLGNGFNCNGLNLTGCPLTVDSMIAMFESLADLTGEAVKTLTLGADNLAKLTDEQKQIATNKNWNLM